MDESMAFLALQENILDPRRIQTPKTYTYVYIYTCVCVII